jgi:hypothetical protein
MASTDEEARLAAQNRTYLPRHDGQRREFKVGFGTALALHDNERREGIMTHAFELHYALSTIGRFLEHAAAVVLGLVMMVVGLALGVTMIMLPVGIVIGLAGVALVVGGLFARITEVRRS